MEVSRGISRQLSVNEQVSDNLWSQSLPQYGAASNHGMNNMETTASMPSAPAGPSSQSLPDPKKIGTNSDFGSLDSPRVSSLHPLSQARSVPISRADLYSASTAGSGMTTMTTTMMKAKSHCPFEFSGKNGEKQCIYFFYFNPFSFVTCQPTYFSYRLISPF